MLKNKNNFETQFAMLHAKLMNTRRMFNDHRFLLLIASKAKNEGAFYVAFGLSLFFMINWLNIEMAN